MANVNWQDLMQAAGEATFEALPPGLYDVIIDSAEATKAASGKDMIKTVFMVETGPYAKKKVFNQFVITTDNPNALAFFFRHMNALGLTDAFFATNPQTEQVASALVGRRARVKLSIRQWNEQDRNNVDQVLAPLGVAPVAPAPSAAPLPTGPVANGPGNAPVYAPPVSAVPPPPSGAPAPPVAPPSTPTAPSVNATPPPVDSPRISGPSTEPPDLPF